MSWDTEYSEETEELAEMIVSIARGRGIHDDRISMILMEAMSMIEVKMDYRKIDPESWRIVDFMGGEYETNGTQDRFRTALFSSIMETNSEVGKTILPEVFWDDNTDPVY